MKKAITNYYNPYSSTYDGLQVTTKYNPKIHMKDKRPHPTPNIQSNL